MTVDAHKPIDIPHSNSYTDTVVQFAINSIICPDLQMSWQGKQVLGPIDGRQVLKAVSLTLISGLQSDTQPLELRLKHYKRLSLSWSTFQWNDL